MILQVVVLLIGLQWAIAQTGSSPVLVRERERERERLQSVIVNWLFEKDRSLERDVACLRDVKSPGSHDNLSGNGPWLQGTLFLTLFWTLF